MSGRVESARPDETPPRSTLSLLSPTQVAGHVFDPADLDRRFVVELLVDGYAAALGRADLYDPDLARDGFGDGCYGFVFSIEPAALRAARIIEIRLANRGEILGAPLLMQALSPASGAARQRGDVRWIGGLRFTGWVGGPQGGAQSRQRRIRAFVDGQLAAETVAAHWTHVGDGPDATAVQGFDLHLPARFADGCARSAQILDESGRELPGSPCAFAAFEGGLAHFLENCAEIESEKLRGSFFDRIIPQSMPFAQFAQWRKMFPLAAPGAVEPLPKIGVALVGETDLDATVASLEAQQGCEWVAVVMEAGAGRTGFDNASLRQFLDGEASGCEAVIFAPSGAIFEPSALAHLARALALFPTAAAAYCDFTFPAEDGGEWPVALSAFDYERMLEQGCGALLFALRTSFARAAAAKGAADLFRLFNSSQDGRRARGPRQSDSSLAGAPVHAPGFLARLPRLDRADASTVLARANAAHFSARGMAAEITPDFGGLFPMARIKRAPSRGKISLLVPTRDRLDLLKPCVDSLYATVDLARHELILLDNDSSDPATLAYFEQAAQSGVRVVRVGGPFNFARIINKGVSVAAGEFILLLNNDVEALAPGWLEEMLGRMTEPDVGAVGAVLLWPSSVVQHGGVVLGSNFAATHAFNDRIDGDPGYADLLRAAHECSSVTAACLLTDRQLFLDIDGFDGLHFPINFNDVDYCLKVRARGLRIVQATQAKLLHRESSSRGLDERADQRDRFQRELRNLRAAWGDILLADPYYNPMLSLDQIPFSALAWPPRPARPRQNFSAPPRIQPPGF